MSHPNVHNVNVASQEISGNLPLYATQYRSATTFTIGGGDPAIGGGVTDRVDHRLMVVVGPCSIHDTAAAMEYARNSRRSLTGSVTPC